MSASLSSMVAAFVSLGIIFTIGLLLISFFKLGDELETPVLSERTAGAQIIAKPTNLSKKSEELTADKLSTVVASMNDGDVISLMFYSTGCPWCRKFKSETIEVLEKDDKLPFPIMMIQASPEMKEHIGKDETLKKIASEVKGLPTSVVLQKKEDGLYYFPIVGFLPPDGFLKKAEESLQNSKKV